MNNIYILTKSTRKGKKWMVRREPGGRLIHFGAEGYEDYTQHKDPERRERYLARHRSRENWTKSGIDTAGFWSKHILWNQTTLSGSIKDIERKFGIKIKRR